MWRWLIEVLSWVHLQLVEPTVRCWEEVVLGSWEEWLLALVRQGFEETTRFLNALGTWFLSWFNERSYREQLRRAWQENSWQQWWGEVATRPSTLNALVANLVAQQQQRQRADPEEISSTSSANGTSPVNTPGLHEASNGISPSLPNGAGMQVPAASQATSSRTPPTGLPHASEAAPSPEPAQPASSGAHWWSRHHQDHVSGRFGRGRRQGASVTVPRLDRPVVFVQQSGMGILDELAKRRHGLIEDAKMAAQLAVSRAFELARTTVRAVLFLPSREALLSATWGASRREGLSATNGVIVAAPAGEAHDLSAGEEAAAGGRYLRHDGGPASAGSGTTRGSAHKVHLQRSKSAHVSIAELAYKPGAGAGAACSSMQRRGLSRSRSYGRLGSGTKASVEHHTPEAPSDALSVIRAAGYPHELHTVTTTDGYMLRLARIPRPGSRDVVFFMHGVLDTSMAWVSGGVTGSQAFGAWEAGFDVWLGNSRGNAPRQHRDPACRGRRYWQYNINHMGMYDIAAQLDHIHNIKCAELGAGTVTLDLDHLGPLAGNLLGRAHTMAAEARGEAAAAAGGRWRHPSGAAAGSRPDPGALLPDRAASTCATQPVQQGGPVGAGRGASWMRHSNSDGNLCRRGSGNSATSLLLPVPASAGPQPDPASPPPHYGLVTASAAVGAAERGAPDGVAAPGLHLDGVSGPCTSMSAASLGRTASNHGDMSPAASYGGSTANSQDGARSGSGNGGGGGGHGGGDGAAGRDAGASAPAAREGAQPAGAAVPPEPSCTSAKPSPAMLSHGGGGGFGAEGSVPLPPPSSSAVSPALSANAITANADNTSTAPRPPPVSSPLPPASSARGGGASPGTAVRRNAVTLTLTSPQRTTRLAHPTASAAGAGGAGTAAGDVEDAKAGLPALPTTFTLEAKTRLDFEPGGSGNVAELRAATATIGRPSAAAGNLQPGGASAGVVGGGGGAGGAGAASKASVLDAVGSVLGPAADAVTAAVASAAATAGAAIATAAASATHLLHPSPSPSPQRPTPGTAPAPVFSGAPLMQRSAPLLNPFAHAGPPAAGGSRELEAVDVDVEEHGGDIPGPLPGLDRVSTDSWFTRHTRDSPVRPTALRSGGALSPAPDRNPGSAAPSPTALPQAPSADTPSPKPPATAPGLASSPRRRTAPLCPEVSDGGGCAGGSFRRVLSTDLLDCPHRTTLAAAAAGAPPTAIANGALEGDLLPPGPGPAAAAASGLGGSAFASASEAALAAMDRTASGRLFPSASILSLSHLADRTGSHGLSSGGSSGTLAGPYGHGFAFATPSEPYNGSQTAAAAAGANGTVGGVAGPRGSAPTSSSSSGCPYKLRCVAHSLGGMSVLIHLVNRLREGRPHHVSRLLLLTPAGFHGHYPKVSRPIMWALPLVTRLLRAVFGRAFSFPLYIPTPLARALTFKLLLSASRIPGLGELLRTCYKALLDGDISQWDRALQMPHYSAQDMPAISVDQVLHLAQLASTGAFRLYDYGSPAANSAHYGYPSPPDVSSEYWRLDLPVHLVAGRRDGIIPPPNIVKHLEAMRAQGVAVSYREFDFGHLDFTFGVKEELRMYLMKVLRL